MIATLPIYAAVPCGLRDEADREPVHGFARCYKNRDAGVWASPRQCVGCGGFPEAIGPHLRWRPAHVPVVFCLFVGCRNPDFLADDAAAFAYHHRDAQTRFEIAFLVDGDPAMAGQLSARFGLDRVYCTCESNGWGRGILRGIVHALDYFRDRLHFTDLLSFDDDALTVGPLLDRLIDAVDAPDVLFVAGANWPSPYWEHHYHRDLYAAGLMAHRPWRFTPDIPAGPCLLWTKACLDLMESEGLLDPATFDRWYPHIRFAHDQWGTYLYSVGSGTQRIVPGLMDMTWRRPLPFAPVEGFGNVPIVRPSISLIHPVRSDAYAEATVRAYFRSLRSGRPARANCGCGTSR